jgi:DNA-binding NarL/FixJ family response regulator
MEQCPLNNVLVIDEVPLIATGLQEVFRSLQPSIKVEFFENIYAALGRPNPEGRGFDLIVLGSWPEDPLSHLYPSIAGLKEKFGASRVMIYSSAYDPVIIEKMEAAGIDAYVHKFESIEEIRKAYCLLAKGESYVSGIYHALYYAYGQGVRK